MKGVKVYFLCLTVLILVKWVYALTIDDRVAVLEASKKEVIDFLVLVLVVAPICETVLFQVLLYHLLPTKPLAFLLLSALGFSCWHYHPSGNGAHYVMYFVTATVYGLFFIKVSTNKWVAFLCTVVLHASYNGLAFVYNTFLEF